MVLTCLKVMLVRVRECNLVCFILNPSCVVTKKQSYIDRKECERCGIITSDYI